jgi:Cytochrome c554 and c-prime
MVFGAAPQVPRASATNQCAVCHLKLVWTTSAITHVDQWVTSRHALYGVGCEKCHGGDGRTSDATAAHHGVIHSNDPSSAVHAKTLPATCGRCHRSEAEAFARSTHRTLLARGDLGAPTCTSCHTSMAADLPVSGNIERLCTGCHADDGEPDRARRARRQLEEVVRQRGMLRRARLEIAGLSDVARRTSLMADWTAADASLRSAVASIHSFDQVAVDARIADSRHQIDRLLAVVH